MRGLAAVWVVLHHASLSVSHFIGPLAHDAVPRNGHLGVDFFFVLSGFIIAHSSAQLVARGQGLRAYVRARLVRVYVPYLPVGVAMLLAYSVFPALSGSGREVGVFTTLTLLPSNVPPALSVAWTLVHEVISMACSRRTFSRGGSTSWRSSRGRWWWWAAGGARWRPAWRSRTSSPRGTCRSSWACWCSISAVRSTRGASPPPMRRRARGRAGDCVAGALCVRPRAGDGRLRGAGVRGGVSLRAGAKRAAVVGLRRRGVVRHLPGARPAGVAVGAGGEAWRSPARGRRCARCR